MHGKRLKVIVTVCTLSISLTLGGCGLITNGTNQTPNQQDSAYIPVQDYVGQGYSLLNGEETGAFAKTHRKEIIDQVNKYFKEKYNLEVMTHNLVGAQNAVVAFVESKREPHFHTSVNVGVDLENNKLTGSVWANEGIVEGAITSGLYEMAYENEFKNLDSFAETVVKQYPVIGKKQQAIDNTWSFGYATPYYYIGTSDSFFPDIYKAFMNNHNISKSELRKLVEIQPFKHESIHISFTFYMKERHALPNLKIANEIISKFKNFRGAVPGTYGIFIQSNDILKRTGTEKTYKGTVPAKDDIIKVPRN